MKQKHNQQQSECMGPKSQYRLPPEGIRYYYTVYSHKHFLTERALLYREEKNGQLRVLTSLSFWLSSLRVLCVCVFVCVIFFSRIVDALVLADPYFTVSGSVDDRHPDGRWRMSEAMFDCKAYTNLKVLCIHSSRTALWYVDLL